MPSSSRPLTTLDPGRLCLPEKPALEGLEARWAPLWEQTGVYRFEQDITVQLSHTEDAKEAQRAFAEKRAPIWKGR